jgi:hypothetical protein
LGEPRRPQEGVPQDQKRPAFAEHAETAGDRTTRVGGLCHSPIVPSELEIRSQCARL